VGSATGGSAGSVAAGTLAGRARRPLPESVRALTDLALIGTVADVAPILGENRSIAQLGLEQLRAGARPGLAALIERAGVARDRLDLTTSDTRSRHGSTLRAGWGRRAARRDCCSLPTARRPTSWPPKSRRPIWIAAR